MCDSVSQEDDPSVGSVRRTVSRVAGGTGQGRTRSTPIRHRKTFTGCHWDRPLRLHLRLSEVELGTLLPHESFKVYFAYHSRKTPFWCSHWSTGTKHINFTSDSPWVFRPYPESRTLSDSHVRTHGLLHRLSHTSAPVCFHTPCPTHPLPWCTKYRTVSSLSHPSNVSVVTTLTPFGMAKFCFVTLPCRLDPDPE